MNKEMDYPIVAKFGGTSLADPGRIEHVAEIVHANPNRRHIVVSAPGKRFAADEKITDLLLQSNSLVEQGLPFDQAFAKVTQRYEDIGRGLHCHSSVVGWLNNVYEGLRKNEGKDWIASRGEWLMAKIFANFLGGSFVDAAQLIKFKENGQVSPLSYELIKDQLSFNSVYHVIPGFYGSDEKGNIKIFARGGSDITGAIVARGVGAKTYENWTDVDGLRAADPRIVANPRVVGEITYEEMRELGNVGAEVLQRDTILSVYEIGIPINIRNTFNPDHSGTLVVSNRPYREGEGVIGIAGKSGYASINIRKYGMNEEIGIGNHILQIFKESDMSYEHSPSGRDVISVIIDQKDLESKESIIISRLQSEIVPTNISVQRHLGLISIVGQDIKNNASDVCSALFPALKKVSIPVRTILMADSEINIVIGIDSERLGDAIRVLYEALITN